MKEILICHDLVLDLIKKTKYKLTYNEQKLIQVYLKAYMKQTHVQI